MMKDQCGHTWRFLTRCGEVNIYCSKFGAIAVDANGYEVVDRDGWWKRKRGGRVLSGTPWRLIRRHEIQKVMDENITVLLRDSDDEYGEVTTLHAVDLWSDLYDGYSLCYIREDSV